MLMIIDNMYEALAGNQRVNKGTCTIICNALIIPHKNYNDPESIKLIAKLPATKHVEPIAITVPTAESTDAVPIDQSYVWAVLIGYMYPRDQDAIPSELWYATYAAY